MCTASPPSCARADVPHVAARVAVVPWPHERWCRSGECGRGGSDPALRMPDRASGRSACARPCHPPRRSRSRSIGPCRKASGEPEWDVVPDLRDRTATCGSRRCPTNRREAAARVRLRLDEALNPFRDGLLAGERPRGGGEDGDAHRHPARCRSRHAEMGGRSQPRPRWPDRLRRSGGCGVNTSTPVTWGIHVLHTGTRIPCTSTPTWDVHARIGIGDPRPAIKTGPLKGGGTAIP